jgi:NDP-sugar pyrophosphorylase family protein
MYNNTFAVHLQEIFVNIWQRNCRLHEIAFGDRINATFEYWRNEAHLMESIEKLYDLTHTKAAPLFVGVTYPWEVLPKIGDFILQLGAKLPADEYDHPAPDVWIAKSATVAPTASITGPCIIGEDTEVRHCAFIRGKALVGAHCVVGNSTELKNVILFDNVQVPHYNYVGDSILGFHAHMGAGSINSNVKGDRFLVVVHDGAEHIETGLKKFGAMLGDWAEIGCGCVLNPGTVVGCHTIVYPLSSVRGVVPSHSVYKKAGEIAQRREQ